MGFPSHTTHLLQPLDIGIFSPYKQYHANAIAEWTRLGCVKIDKLEFIAMITKIRDQTFKYETITLAWRKSGIFPLEPSYVLDKLPREKEAN